MSELSDFMALVNHKKPSRIPYYFTMTDDLNRRLTEKIGSHDFQSHYKLFAPVDVYPTRPESVSAPDFSPYWAKEVLPPGTRINYIGVAEVPSNLYHFWGYISPLRNATSIKEIENYPIEDMANWDMSNFKSIVDDAHKKGKIIRGWVGHIYENAWQIRGYEQFLMDLIEHPAWAHRLLERIAQQCMIRAKAYAAAGVDLITCGDDVANQTSMMFSREIWQNMLFAHWQPIWQEIKRVNPNCAICYHSDGNVAEILDVLVDAGLNILNPVQPECLDVETIHRNFGKHLSFDGCIGTQSTMPFGSPQQVRDRVKQVIDTYGRNGGLIISPTHVLEPDVPLENIEAFCQACEEFNT